MRLPSGSEYVVLSGLEWDTEYNAYVVAENEKGKSEPATISFRTSTEPDAIPGTVPQVTHTKLKLDSQKIEEPNSKLDTRASHFIFDSSSERRMTTKSIYRKNRFPGQG